MSERDPYQPADDVYDKSKNAAKKGANRVKNGAIRVGRRMLRKGGKKLAKKAIVAAGKALMVLGKILLALLAKAMVVLGPVLVVCLLAWFGWFLLYEIRGAEQIYTYNAPENEIVIEQQENDGGTGGTGGRNDVKGSFNSYITKDAQGHQQGVQQFYRYHGSNAFYQLFGNDYSRDKLERTEGSGKIRDYYDKEQEYSINENLLFALDEHAYGDQFRYPEQFTKPVYYDEETLSLKSLTDENGYVVAESKLPEKMIGDEEINENAGKKIKSVADYGLGSVFHYFEDEIVQTVEGTITHRDVWDEEQGKVVKEEYGKPFSEVLEGYPIKIHLMDKAVTFAGDYEFKYEDEKSKVGGLAEGIGEKNTNRKKVKYGEYDEYRDVPIWGDVPYEVEVDVYDWVKVLDRYEPIYRWVKVQVGSKPIYGWSDNYIPGSPPFFIGGKIRYWGIIRWEPIYEWKQVQVGSTPIYRSEYRKVGTKTEIRYKREIIGYEKEFVKTHDLYHYREGAVYETKPVEVPPPVEEKTGAEKEQEQKEKLKYLYDYLLNFEAFVPHNVMKEFDFEDRTGQIIDTNFEVGGNADSPLIARVYQEFREPVYKYAERYGVDPYIIFAKIALESGGRIDIEDGPMQIVGDGRRTVTATNVLTGKEETVVVNNEADRRNKDLAVQWGIAYYASQMKKFDGDPLKALQAYNFSPHYIKEKYPESWDSLEWMNYREEARLYYGERETGGLTKSNNYSCMPGYTPPNTDKVYGNSCYIEMVMQYYIGDGFSDIEAASGSGENNKKEKLSGLRKAINFIGSLFGVQRIEYEETEPHGFVRTRFSDKVIDWALSQSVTFDNKLLFSEVDSGGIDLQFWQTDIQRMGNSNLSHELAEMVEAGVFIPPLDMKEPPITSRFGKRIDPITGKPAGHMGVDVGIPVGTPVYSVGDGVVVRAQNVDKGGWGKYVMVDHGGERYSLYGHLNAVNVKVGDEVSRGQHIGDSGNTGRSTGPHLHFEFYEGGSTYGVHNVDPYNILYQPDLFN